jgi:hypothetical protein
MANSVGILKILSPQDVKSWIAKTTKKTLYINLLCTKSTQGDDIVKKFHV